MECCSLCIFVKHTNLVLSFIQSHRYTPPSAVRKAFSWIHEEDRMHIGTFLIQTLSIRFHLNAFNEIQYFSASPERHLFHVTHDKMAYPPRHAPSLPTSPSLPPLLLSLLTPPSSPPPSLSLPSSPQLPQPRIFWVLIQSKNKNTEHGVRPNHLWMHVMTPFQYPPPRSCKVLPSSFASSSRVEKPPSRTNSQTPDHSRSLTLSHAWKK